MEGAHLVWSDGCERFGQSDPLTVTRQQFTGLAIGNIKKTFDKGGVVTISKTPYPDTRAHLPWRHEPSTILMEQKFHMTLYTPPAIPAMTW